MVQCLEAIFFLRVHGFEGQVRKVRQVKPKFLAPGRSGVDLDFFLFSASGRPFLEKFGLAYGSFF